MRVFKLAPAFLFSLLLCTQISVLFLATQANAWSCCGCSCRALGCYCPGQGGCAWYPCHTDDTPILQAKTLIGNEIIKIHGDYDSRPTPALQSNSMDRIITLNSLGECARSNFIQKFFHTGDRLKFEPDFLKYHANQDNNVVAFQIPVPEEK